MYAGVCVALSALSGQLCPALFDFEEASLGLACLVLPWRLLSSRH